jgi:hypothetical protein
MTDAEHDKMNKTQNRTMTLEELKESGAYWQELLSLRDWQVDYRIVRGEHLFNKKIHAAMQGPNNAQCFIAEQQKLAIVKILDPVDWNDDFREQDMEYDLVHELIHIHTNPCEPSEDNKPLHDRMECAINMLARALVRQRREAWKLGEAK